MKSFRIILAFHTDTRRVIPNATDGLPAPTAAVSASAYHAAKQLRRDSHGY
jgi:hypothetical protein